MVSKPAVTALLCGRGAPDLTGRDRETDDSVLTRTILSILPSCIRCIRIQYIRLYVVGLFIFSVLSDSRLVHEHPQPCAPASGPAEMSYAKADAYRSVPRDFGSVLQTCSANIQKITQNSRCCSTSLTEHCTAACLWVIMCL